jgi:hypothetical protein
MMEHILNWIIVLGAGFIPIVMLISADTITDDIVKLFQKIKK